METADENLLRRRKRRRRIGAVSVVLMTLWTWWSWPRGDTRFVGTWDVYEAYPDIISLFARGSPEPSQQEPIQTVSFAKNGSIRIRELRGKNPVTMIAAWNVEGDELQIGYQIPKFIRPFVVSAARTLARTTRRYLVVFEWGNRFQFSGPNEFRVMDRKGVAGHVYRRKS